MGKLNHTDEALKLRIALTLIPGIGDVLGKKLIAYCGSVEAVFLQKKSSLLRIPGIGEFFANALIRQNVFGTAEEEVQFIRKNKINPLFFLDEAYPQRLKSCTDSPLMLYYKGTENLNHPHILSVVGTRRATAYGKECCTSLIEALAEKEVMIVSGLAYGIDICAHKACLKSGIPTVAVLAHGLDAVYPPLHKSAAQKIALQGGLLSDYTSGTNPDRENFPRRNRVVAGMSDATIVVESALDGGSMITAEIANSYSRDVFAFPGRPSDEFSRGCNKLIKLNKAALVEGAEDILQMMGWTGEKPRKFKQQELFYSPDPEESLIMESMRDKGNVHIDEISVLSGMPMRKVSGYLLKLEFAGHILSLPGKMYRLA
jgi:DNA processing protein